MEAAMREELEAAQRAELARAEESQRDDGEGSQQGEEVLDRNEQAAEQETTPQQRTEEDMVSKPCTTFSPKALGVIEMDVGHSEKVSAAKERGTSGSTDAVKRRLQEEAGYAILTKEKTPVSELSESKQQNN